MLNNGQQALIIIVGDRRPSPPPSPTPVLQHQKGDYEGNFIYNLQLFESTKNSPQQRAALLRQTGEEFWIKMFHGFEHLRFARLAAHLRQREPDAEVGYSILIYRLTDEEVARALSGPQP